MRHTLHIHGQLYARWQRYEKQNPAWSGKFDELAQRLLTQHFDEADTMKKSVVEQERKRWG